MTALDVLLGAIDLQEPESLLTLGRAWDVLGRQPVPAPLAPWWALQDLARQPPDAVRLRAAVAACAAPPERLLTEIGFWLPAPWAHLYDTVGGNERSVSPLFGALAVADPERACAHIEAAHPANARAADLLYAALVALHDHGRPVPERLRAHLQRFEGYDPSLVDAGARFVGQLRLASRGSFPQAEALATDVVDWLGVDDAFEGLWALLHRAPEPGAVVERLRPILPRPPNPEGWLHLRTLVGAVPPAEVEVAVAAFLRDLGDLDGRTAWIGATHLLSAAIAVGSGRSVGELGAAQLPAWQVERASWRALRRNPTCAEEVRALVLAGATPAWTLPPPPWAALPLDVFAARIALLADLRFDIPSHHPWGPGPP